MSGRSNSVPLLNKKAFFIALLCISFYSFSSQHENSFANEKISKCEQLGDTYNLVPKVNTRITELNGLVEKNILKNEASQLIADGKSLIARIESNICVEDISSLIGVSLQLAKAEANIKITKDFSNWLDAVFNFKDKASTEQEKSKVDSGNPATKVNEQPKTSEGNPPLLDFSFNPNWDSTVRSNKIVYTRYGFGTVQRSDENPSMVIGIPTQLVVNSNCSTITFFAAPLISSIPAKPAGALSKFATFAVEIWSSNGLKLGFVNSLNTNASNFWAPTPITQIPVKFCDPNLKSGDTNSYILKFRAGLAMVSQNEIRQFEERISVTLQQASTSSQTQRVTITCTKGKTVKKVTGVSPSCPKGYKKK
jgi:hypothetical protein